MKPEEQLIRKLKEARYWLKERRFARAKRLLDGLIYDIENKEKLGKGGNG